MEVINEPKSIEPIALEKPLLFLIDDDEEILSLFKKVLESDFETKTIIDPIEAIQEAEKSSPSGIILDLQMPNIDGYEALKIFREHPFTASIPIICMSSDTGEHIRTRLDSLGANGFLRKPVKTESLAKTLKNIFRSLNQTVKSKRGDFNCTITFNDLEKNKLIFTQVKSLLRKGEKVVFLSWTQGKDFNDDELEKFIEDERLIFLEIKSSMIQKFPFMQNISPIMADIFGFTAESLNNFHLVFDEP
jgi:CheY-like chemotaxis protein